MKILDTLLKYWVIWTTICSLIAGLVFWNNSLDKRIELLENDFITYKEMSKGKEDIMNKSIDDLFDLLRDIRKIVYEIKGWKDTLKNKDNNNEFTDRSQDS